MIDGIAGPSVSGAAPLRENKKGEKKGEKTEKKGLGMKGKLNEWLVMGENNTERKYKEEIYWQRERERLSEKEKNIFFLISTVLLFLSIAVFVNASDWETQRGERKRKLVMYKQNGFNEGRTGEFGNLIR